MALKIRTIHPPATPSIVARMKPTSVLAIGSAQKKIPVSRIRTSSVGMQLQAHARRIRASLLGDCNKPGLPLLLLGDQQNLHVDVVLNGHD